MTAPPAARLGAAELAGEIARTRAHLSRDLAVLDRDYALRHLAVRAVRLARHPEAEARRLREALRLDAAPLALVGLGLGWLSLAGRGSGGELLQRLMGALAALQQLAREFGVAPEAGEKPPPSPPLPPPDGVT